MIAAHLQKNLPGQEWRGKKDLQEQQEVVSDRRSDAARANKSNNSANKTNRSYVMSRKDEEFSQLFLNFCSNPEL